MAERSLFLWNNEYIVSLVAQHRQTILPLIFTALENNVAHWNPAVTGLTNNVRKMFQEMDEELYEECKRQHDNDQVQRPRKKMCALLADICSSYADASQATIEITHVTCL